MNKLWISTLLGIITLSGCQSPQLITPLKKSDKNVVYFVSKVSPAETFKINTGNILKQYKISPDDLEQRLMDLAEKSNLEDSWVYHPKSEILREIGIKETTFSNQITHDFFQFYSEGDHLIMSHIHTSLAQLIIISDLEGSKIKKISPEKLLIDINTHRFRSVPSYPDIVGCYQLTLNAMSKGMTVETRIYDRQGYATFKILPEHMKKFHSFHYFVLESFRAAGIRYHEGKLNFKDLCKEFLEKGVTITYTKLRDNPFTLDELKYASTKHITPNRVGQ